MPVSWPGIPIGVQVCDGCGVAFGVELGLGRQAVAAAAESLNDRGGDRVRAGEGGVELLAEVGDVGLNDVGVVLPVVVVEVFEELALADDDSGAMDEVLEDPVFS